MNPSTVGRIQKRDDALVKLPSFFRGAYTLAASILLSGVALLGMPLGDALAAEPVTLDGAVTDPTGFLSTEQQADVISAIKDTEANGLPVYFVTVPDFSGQEPIDWCLQAITQSNLSNEAVVFAVAYQQRQATHCTVSETSTAVVTDAQIASAFSYALDNLGKSNPLAATDLTQAALDFTNRLSTAAQSPSGTASAPITTRAPRPQASSATSQHSNTGSPYSKFIPFALMIGVSLVLRWVKPSQSDSSSGSSRSGGSSGGWGSSGRGGSSSFGSSSGWSSSGSRGGSSSFGGSSSSSSSQGSSSGRGGASSF